LTRRILSTPRAELDLLDIGLQIAQDSPRAADRMLAKIERRFELLLRNPKLGRIRAELAPSLRSFPIAPYVVFYRIHKSGIEIIRVLHGARDVLGEFE
jgi:toxin ParE1/3/4